MSGLKDMKEALGGARKPDLTHVRRHFAIYAARACEYGSDKYERSNYLRAIDGGMGAQFERFRQYLRAGVSHLLATLDDMERHQANDPNLEDDAGLKCAAYSSDTDITPGAKVGASGLPHVAHACASLMMAIEQAVDAELLPADPGQPWSSK